MAVPLLPHSYVNESDVTYIQIVEVYKIAQPTPASQATLTTFDLNLPNKKSFDLHMFTNNIKNGIVTVNGYLKR